MVAHLLRNGEPKGGPEALYVDASFSPRLLVAVVLLLASAMAWAGKKLVGLRAGIDPVSESLTIYAADEDQLPPVHAPTEGARELAAAGSGQGPHGATRSAARHSRSLRVGSC